MTEFFATLPPTLYDLSMPEVVPGLETGRMIRAEVWRSRFGALHGWTGADLGIGTGADAASLLPTETVGTLFGFDDSETLSDVMRDTGRLPKGCHANVEVRMLAVDLSTGGRRNDLVPPGSCDFVSSAFAIHNLDHSGQAAAFALAAELLRPGGTFLYFDLVAFEDAETESLAHRYDLEFIKDRMAIVPEGVEPREWTGLRRRWLTHYADENFLLPLTARASGPALQNMFADAGLKPPVLLYRQMHTALIVASKA